MKNKCANKIIGNHFQKEDQINPYTLYLKDLQSMECMRKSQ